MSATRHDHRQDRPDREGIAASRNHDPDNPRDVPVCSTCGRYRHPEKSVRGSYCSRKCYYRHKGHKALKNVEKDHRFCRTCFARVKEIEDPPDDAPDFVVGYQYGTPAATTAAREYDRDGVARPLVKQRIGCECGATDLRHWDETLAETDRVSTMINLVAALREKEREDKVPFLDYRRLFTAYRDTGDLEYAVGVGLYE